MPIRIKTKYWQQEMFKNIINSFIHNCQNQQLWQPSMSAPINKWHIIGGILFCDLFFKRGKGKQKPAINIDKQKKPVWKFSIL